MATEKQKKARKNVVENGGNVSKGMRDADYSPATAKNPKKLTDSKGWKELMEKHLPDHSLAVLHNKLLKKEDIQLKNNNETKEIDKIKMGQPHSDSLKALDLAYKLKGKYSPEKKEYSFFDEFAELSDEELIRKTKGRSRVSKKRIIKKTS